MQDLQPCRIFEKYDRSLIKELVKDGLISCDTLIRMDIYFVLNAYLRTGMKMTDAVFNTAEKFRKSESAVYVIKKFFETETTKLQPNV